MKSPGKRTLLTGGGIAAAGLAVVLSTTLTANAAPAPAPAPAAEVVEAPVPVRAAEEPDNTPWGDVIGTGVQGDGGELVFYGVKVDIEQLPQTTFGIMAGHRSADGKVTAGTVTNEYSGPDKSPGFHAVSGGLNGIPSFGYYAGPAAKITAKVNGKTVTAHQAAWSVDPNIVVFWFDSAADPLKLAAFDASGKKLPVGNPDVGHG
ncbi:hypothetical protein [Amycolatopsis regifaucium]|uniref:Uncharacterized protein n=1 Tax=Amycolatopsis regifaucium TaxID=546365 RepID=A0A154MAN4_9PSEU|nr:hypothetical protein [Amycolatopsis regifaucium]KZB81655.1 hypothetical protein AVL48_06580 [Amycolatopsis regifaucium]OKA06281.1 hypothetical protein ATP06_0224440 [Amycolatopsis regifaucium]SFG66714.1 hypothetical protein SAMN04489731_10181 [Amycolatopsis regifaucium]